jgi:hypothetical protein
MRRALGKIKKGDVLARGTKKLTLAIALFLCVASPGIGQGPVLADHLAGDASFEPEAAAQQGCTLFYDVPRHHWYYDYINKIAMRSVTLGCGGGNYCPDNTPENPTLGLVTRGQMAAFLIRARGEFDPPMPATQRFADVPPSNPFYKFIDRMAVLGITLGCDTTGQIYCPDGFVTRGEIATFLERAVNRTNPPIPPSQRFSDVLPGHTFYRFIDSFVVNNLSRGIMNVVKNKCVPNNDLFFCPQRHITRDEMAAFLVIQFQW